MVSLVNSWPSARSRSQCAVWMRQRDILWARLQTYGGALQAPQQTDEPRPWGYAETRPRTDGPPPKNQAAPSLWCVSVVCILFIGFEALTLAPLASPP